MVNIDKSPQLLEFIRICAIILGLFHFLFGMSLLFQITKVRETIKTPTLQYFNAATYLYVIVLLLVILLAIVF